jgi:hypothetical protein
MKQFIKEFYEQYRIEISSAIFVVLIAASFFAGVFFGA